MTHSNPRATRRWLWPVLTMAAALLPVAGAFSLSRIFHVRDLSLFFWPRHLWLRRTVGAGEWPWWDPHPAAGQSAAADPLHQLFFPPALALRLLLPEIPGFNWWVALPLPVAALGAYLLFREHRDRPAASLGALVFTLSGPIVSAVVYPNLSWSIALLPWVVLAAGRAARAPRGLAIPALAIAVALQALAGEPVTFAATLALAAAYAWVFGDAPWRTRLMAPAAGVLAGVALAAVQLLPLAAATAASARAGLTNEGAWSLHPLSVLEFVLPRVFGSPYDAASADLPWMTALNSGSDPLLYSLYVGMGVLTLMAAALATADRRGARFWLGALVLAVVAALGAYSPPYRALQAIVPLIETFRFPVKYLAIAALAAGGLAAAGWSALAEPATARRRGVRAALAILGSGAVVMVVLAFALQGGWLAAPLTRLAAWLGIDSAMEAAAMLQASAVPMVFRAAALAAAGAALIVVATSTHPARRMALAALFVFAIADAAVVNGSLHPTMDAAALRAPDWVEALRRHGEGRVYVGGRLPDPEDIRFALDGSRSTLRPAALTAMEGRTLEEFEYAMTPSAWGLHEVVSYDLPMLWPREYTDTLRAFRRVDAAGRATFLARTATRYCLVREPFHYAPIEVMRQPDEGGLVLYECTPAAARVFVTVNAAVEPDLAAQIPRLFDRALPLESVLLEAASPAPAGTEGSAARQAAAIIEDAPRRVVVRASAGAAGGHLVLLDSYSAEWRATVDGMPAPIERANVLFRAVRLAPGEHTVVFEHRPVALYAGAAISLLALLGLAVLSFRPVFCRMRAPS